MNNEHVPAKRVSIPFGSGLVVNTVGDQVREIAEVSIPFGSGLVVNRDVARRDAREAVSIPFGSGLVVNPLRALIASAWESQSLLVQGWW